METTKGCIGLYKDYRVYIGLYRDNGKEAGNYYLGSKGLGFRGLEF